MNKPTVIFDGGCFAAAKNYRSPGEIIRQIVSEVSGVSLPDILSKRKSKRIARARQIGMALAREHTNMSTPQIANTFLSNEHSSVIYAVKNMPLYMAREPNTATWYRRADELVIEALGGRKGQTELELAWATCSPNRIEEFRKALDTLGYTLTITKKCGELSLLLA